MKASELIKILQDNLDEYGDRHVNLRIQSGITNLAHGDVRYLEITDQRVAGQLVFTIVGEEW